MSGDIQNFTSFSAVSVPSSGTVALNGGVLSLNTISFSIKTAADASGIPDGFLGLIQRASGFSLIYKSGGTVYTVGTSAVSGVA